MISITLGNRVEFFIDEKNQMGFRKDGMTIVLGGAHRADFDGMLRCILRLRIHTIAHPDVAADRKPFDPEM